MNILYKERNAKKRQKKEEEEEIIKFKKETRRTKVYFKTTLQ